MQVIGTTFPNQDGLTVHRKEGVGIGDGGDHDVEQPNEENQLWSHPTERLPSTYSSKFMSLLYP